LVVQRGFEPPVLFGLFPPSKRAEVSAFRPEFAGIRFVWNDQFQHGKRVIKYD
jgi:hypothetical protein